jgi:hypothetical protein
MARVVLYASPLRLLRLFAANNSLIQQMNYTPALIPRSTPDGSAPMINASVDGERVSLNFSSYLVSLNIAKLQFTLFDAN